MIVTRTQVIGGSGNWRTGVNGVSTESKLAAHSGGRWLDTLRIVEFVLRGPSVHSASALGEFNRWQRAVTPLARVASNEWRVRVLVPRDALSMSAHVAVLVNGEHIVPSSMR